MSRTAASGTPVGTSTTAGCDAEPPTLSRTVPGSSGVPTAAKRSGPSRASTASWANVPALDSSVGRSATPKSLARILRPGGTGRLPLIPQTRLGRDGRLDRPVRQFVARDPDHDLFGADGLGHQRRAAEDEVGRADHE